MVCDLVSINTMDHVLMVLLSFSCHPMIPGPLYSGKGETKYKFVLDSELKHYSVGQHSKL